MNQRGVTLAGRNGRPHCRQWRGRPTECGVDHLREAERTVMAERGQGCERGVLGEERSGVAKQQCGEHLRDEVAAGPPEPDQDFVLVWVVGAQEVTCASEST